MLAQAGWELDHETQASSCPDRGTDLGKLAKSPAGAWHTTEHDPLTVECGSFGRRRRRVVLI
jgi:hypothetical protein